MNTKTTILTLLAGIAAAFAVGCGTAPTNGTNTIAVQTNATAHGNMPMNHNSMMNYNGIPMNAANHDMSQMPHGEMMGKSDPGAASQPYDLQFIDTMTLHHEGAIQMSKMISAKTRNEELKKFAGKIIDDQQKEISQMKEWREKWFAGKAAAKNMEMPGMSGSMKMMSADHLKMMEAMSGSDFDAHFLDMMIPHHEDAVTMAKDALQKAERAEIKTLANQIIKAQEAEIKQMKEWKERLTK